MELKYIVMGKKSNGNKRLWNLNKKDKLIEPDLSKLSKQELIDLANWLLSKQNTLENRIGGYMYFLPFIFAILRGRFPRERFFQVPWNSPLENALLKSA